MRRKDFLIGLGGVVVGVPLGAAAGRSELWQRQAAPAATLPAPSARPTQGQVTYAQAGEDVVVSFIFGQLKIKDISYLDIGAYDPVYINNTYFFYQHGHRGVLVEPNVTMCEKLRAAR